jgi:hypothetical protein
MSWHGLGRDVPSYRVERFFINSPTTPRPSMIRIFFDKKLLILAKPIMVTFHLAIAAAHLVSALFSLVQKPTPDRVTIFS